ncbi:hypothetical protein Tco_0417961 [Tanacetum coccineum]
MFEEDQPIDVGALPKFDMPLYTSDMTAKDVKSLALRHGIPLDLHPVALTKEWTMDKLPDDMIGLYEQYFELSGIRVPFYTFLLAVIKHFRVHISQLVPLWLNRLTMFELYCQSLEGWRAIPDAMAWRHHDSDVNDPCPEDGFSALDVQMLTKQDQTILEKTDHQKSVEVEDPKIVAIRERKARAAAKKRERKRKGGDSGEGSHPATKRKKTAAQKDGSAASEATSSPEPIQSINPIGPTGAVAETAESREDRLPRASPRGSADHSVHNFSGTHYGDGEAETLRLGTFGDQLGRAMTHVDTEVVIPRSRERKTGFPTWPSRDGKFDCIRKLLPTVVERLFQSHEYKQSLSEPFNLAIQAGWDKGLAEERSEEALLELMGRMEGFDVYADKRMKVEYDKLFEK